MIESNNADLRLEELVAENEILRQKLNEANQAKAKFISVVTHELRLPLTAIKGYSDLMLTGAVGPVNEQQASFLNVIRKNVERMSMLITDLSDLSHFESGRLKINLLPFELPGVLEEVLLKCQPAVDEKKQSLKVETGEDLPRVNGDRTRTSQVLSAMLSNACKYTPEGGSITVRAFTEDGFVKVEVNDTGIGIHPKDQPLIFTQFFRSEDPAVREHQGWGLNLCVAKYLVEFMGGKIGFQSAPQAGSCFWFTLPAAGEFNHTSP